MSERKEVVAIDVDDTLLALVPGFCKYLRESCGINITPDMMWGFSFSDVLGLPLDETLKLVNAFYRTSDFANLSPIEGSQEAVGQLSQRYGLVVVTSRPTVLPDGLDMQNITITNLQTHFPGRFKQVLFSYPPYQPGNQQAKTKAEICQDIGAKVLIDDHPAYLQACTGLGIRGLLFPARWNEGVTGFTRVTGWAEVVEKLS